MPTEQILTKHPLGKSGRTITRARYDAVRQAIVSVLSLAELTHTELMEALGRSLGGSFDGNVRWYGETVKLDLEARQVIGRPPMRWSSGLLVATVSLAVTAAVTLDPSAQAAAPEQAAGGATAPAPDPGPRIPDGFTPIFNGKDLTGWHVSKTNHHGTTPEFRVAHGVIVGTQNPRGKGGILLTDQKYKDVEVYMEIKPDWGCDSGLFLRSSEAGEAYQVTLDYLPGGSMGGIYGERLTGVRTSRGAREVSDAPASPGAAPDQGRGRPVAWQDVWKREAWNSVRARIEGDVPHITVWINDQLVTDFTDSANHAANGATDGMLAIQMHFTDEKTNRWVDAGFWRWRAIAVKELAYP